jgi:hypothetical protein
VRRFSLGDSQRIPGGRVSISDTKNVSERSEVPSRERRVSVGSVDRRFSGGGPISSRIRRYSEFAEAQKRAAEARSLSPKLQDGGQDATAPPSVGSSEVLMSAATETVTGSWRGDLPHQLAPVGPKGLASDVHTDDLLESLGENGAFGKMAFRPLNNDD